MFRASLRRLGGKLASVGGYRSSWGEQSAGPGTTATESHFACAKSARYAPNQPDSSQINQIQAKSTRFVPNQSGSGQISQTRRSVCAVFVLLLCVSGPIGFVARFVRVCACVRVCAYTRMRSVWVRARLPLPLAGFQMPFQNETSRAMSVPDSW
eukprot:3814331-Rhodomonas_salina.1